MSIIDCRFRPTTPEFLCYIEPEPALFEIMKSRPCKPEPMETSIKLMKNIGITGGVISGREWAAGGHSVSNEYIASLVKKHPDFNIIPVAGVDPTLSEDKLTANLEYALRDLKLKGASVDPFVLETNCADKRFYPIYKLCQDYNVPVMITIGPFPMGRGRMEWCHPNAADIIANDFPNLKILLSHAGFPYTQELIAIVWRNKNVYFENSLYYKLPGANMVVDAVNNYIHDKMVWASAYPFADYNSALNDFYQAGYKECHYSKILTENAQRLFDVSF